MLIPEPAGQGGACVTARKGVGRFVMRVEGRGAHSGGAFEEGASAVVELARQIVRIHGMVDLDRGITLNAAPVWGGSRPNVISPDAGCEIDLRVNSVGDGVHMERTLLESTALTPGCRVVVEGGMNRPPFAEDARHPRAVRQGARHRRDGGDRVAAAASRRRIGRQFHRGDGRADAGWTGLSRLRRAREPRAHLVAAACAARGADGGTAGDAGIILETAGGRGHAVQLPGLHRRLPADRAGTLLCGRGAPCCATDDRRGSPRYFYGWWDIRFVPLLAGLTVANWLIVHLVRCNPRRSYGCSAWSLNLAVLGLFKYADFFRGTAWRSRPDLPAVAPHPASRHQLLCVSEDLLPDRSPPG